jgi:hypothetical protein
MLEENWLIFFTYLANNCRKIVLQGTLTEGEGSVQLTSKLRTRVYLER